MPDQIHNTMGLKAFYRHQMFFPGLPGLFLNPSYFARKGLADQINGLSRFIGGKTLDIGCGTRPYENCFRVSQYIGLEINSAEEKALVHADVRYDGYTIPFKDDAFDSVLAFEVLEHIFEPEIFLQEIRRILKPEGMLLLTAPFLWGEHEKPHDFARYSSFGLRFLLEKHDFQILKAEKTMTGVRAVLQILNTCLYNRFSRKNRIWNLFIAAFLIGPINMAGALVGHVGSKNRDLYLDNVVLTCSPKHQKNRRCP